MVLTLDGSNVALAPMLLGLEAGLQSTIQDLYPLTLTDNLVASFLHHVHKEQTTVPFGTKGFWDSISSPKVYTLSDLSSLATDAIIAGGIDGFILGSEVSTSNHREQSLSDLLKSYYSHQPDATGLDASPRLISQKRRMNFKKLVSFSLLKSQMVQTICFILFYITINFIFIILLILMLIYRLFYLLIKIFKIYNIYIFCLNIPILFCAVKCKIFK